MMLCVPSSAFAVLLDCEVTREGYYRCIEVGESSASGPGGADVDAVDETYQGFREQARSQCVYEEPRKRAGGKNSGVTQRSEALKSARNRYEKCVSDTARDLWREHRQRQGE